MKKKVKTAKKAAPKKATKTKKVAKKAAPKKATKKAAPKAAAKPARKKHEEITGPAKMGTKDAMSVLKKFFNRNGYVRTRDEKKAEKLGNTYKKGYEVRFVAMSASELATLRRAIKSMGFEPNRPYQKHSRWIQPLYGREITLRFAAMMK